MPAKIKRRPMAEAIMRAVEELKAAKAAGVWPPKDWIIHTVSFPEPGQHTATSIRKLRTKLGLSQASFARMLGISTALMQGWEQGVRHPSKMARRLLDTISLDPAAWLASVWKSSRRAG